ncbi:MAG: hypothetical protein OHK0039_01370 [Bacteroidia bacterium]
MAVADGFHCMITTDQRLPYQQHLDGIPLSILILPTTSWPLIRKHKEFIAQAVEDLASGLCLRITFPSP